MWSISLLFGWEEFRFMQLIGYAILTFSIYKFNEEEKRVIQNAEMEMDEEVKLARVEE